MRRRTHRPPRACARRTRAARLWAGRAL